MSLKNLMASLKNPLKTRNEELTEKYVPSKTHFSMLGTVASGKTAVAGGLLLTAQTLSSMYPEFRCRILEGSSGLRVAASNLRRGMFPPKTPANLPAAPEAGLLLYWGSWKGEKKVQIPICDISGEKVQAAIQKHGSQMYPSAEAYEELDELMKYVYDADGFILIVPASRALMFDEDAKIEPEPEGIAHDPDVNLSRILDSVFQFKEETGAKKIRGIAVVITKWDLLQPYAKKKKMDIQEPTGTGLNNFMNTCFPDTTMSLKAYGMQTVRFFPSYFKVMKDRNGVVKWPGDGDRIEMHPKILRMPKYPEQSYKQMFDYLKSFAS